MNGKYHEMLKLSELTSIEIRMLDFAFAVHRPVQFSDDE